MKRILTLLLAALMLCTLACQPTPEEDIVVNKGEGTLEERIFASPVPIETEIPAPTSEDGDEDAPSPTSGDNEELLPYSEGATGTLTIPEHWTDDLSNEYVKVRIDADIITSGQTTYPVYLVEEKTFSDEDYARIFQSLIPDAVKYRGMVRSYEEYELQLESAVRGAEKRNADGSISYVSWPQQQNAIESAQKYLRGATHVEELYKELPANITPKGIILRSDGTEALAIHSSDRIEINLSNNGIVQPQSWRASELWDEDVYVTYHPEITEAEAQAVAEQFLQELGIEGMSVVHYEPCRVFSPITFSVESYGYLFRFTRAFDYMGYYDSQPGLTGLFSFEDDTAYMATLQKESIEVYVTHEGVHYFMWKNPLEIVSCVNENVQLLPFEDIQSNAVKLLKAGFADTDSKSAIGVCMAEMILSVYPQRLADNQGTVMVPMWLMIFDVYLINADTMVVDFDPKLKQKNYQIFVGINAIDGSRVAFAESGTSYSG
ncbi:MAG: DUF6034 family protein [Clostridia bacterium]|nr:DUF6034 family protein [Clostridia bacterium]